MVNIGSITINFNKNLINLGITGGDIKYLSTAAFLGTFYNHEKTFGSISLGAFKSANSKLIKKSINKYFKKQTTLEPNLERWVNYEDLKEVRDEYQNMSVWRFKDGTHTLIQRLADVVSNEYNVKINLNDPIQSIKVNHDKKEKSITLVSKSGQQDADIVISSVYSKSKENQLKIKFYLF